MVSLSQFVGVLYSGPTYFGSTINQYIVYLAVIAVAALLGKTLSYVIDTRLHRYADGTKTKLDDTILHAIGGPVILLVMLVAAIVARPVLTLAENAAVFLDNTVTLFVILAGSWLVIRLVDGIITTYVATFAERTESQLDEQLVPVLNRATKISIIIIAAIVVLDSFGYDVAALIASLGVGGLAVAFAARETIADIFGGITIFTSRPFVVGESVKIGSVEGTVEEVGLRFTRIRTWDRQLVTMPNRTVANENIVNISREPARRIVMYLGLTYDTAAENVEKVVSVLQDAVNSVDGIKTDDTRVWFWEYGDSALRFRVQYFIEDLVNKWDVRHAVNIAIKKTIETHGFELAYPTQTVHLKK